MHYLTLRFIAELSPDYSFCTHSHYFTERVIKVETLLICAQTEHGSVWPARPGVFRVGFGSDVEFVN